MDKRTEIIQRITAQGMLPLYFNDDADTSIQVLKALYQAGIRTVEFTNRGAAALEVFKKLRRACDDEFKDMFLGAGTIKDAGNAEHFLNAGADFLVSPGLAEDVFDVAYADKILWIPGCVTPTEIIRAERFGIELIKLFPGSLLGPSFVRAIKDVFPQLQFMPTGGVEPEKENLRAWFDAGVCAVGMGSRMISKTLLEKKDFTAITKQAASVLAMIKEARMN